MVYQSKISSKMTIDHKTGKVNLEKLDIDVGGYKNSKILREAKESYDSGKVKTKQNGKEWPRGLWYSLFREYYNMLKAWKRK